MYGPPPVITLIRKKYQTPWKYLKYSPYWYFQCHTLPFFPLLPCFGLDTQRDNQPLYLYSQIIFWLWRYNYHLVKTAKLQRYVQCDVIMTTTIFIVYRCELTKCEILLTYEFYLLEHNFIEATMINRQWCYNW